MVLHVRIDNLPPDKSWSQVRQLVGSIVPPSLVLQVKMLPPMSSMVPPFQLIKSCVVTEGKHRPDDAAELADGHKQLPMGLL